MSCKLKKIVPKGTRYCKDGCCFDVIICINNNYVPKMRKG